MSESVYDVLLYEGGAMMKQILVIVLTLALVLAVLGGCTGSADLPEKKGEQCPSEEVTRTEDKASVRFLRYRWDGWGLSTKTVEDCDVVYCIIDALKGLTQTGKTVAQISDDVIDQSGPEYPVEYGTVWIECANNIYRLTPDLSQICRVETHFGKGEVLEMTGDLKNHINNAWYYAPYDYYRGTYNPGDTTVELKNVFPSDSTVQLRVKEIHIESDYDPQNTITVELISEINQEVTAT